MSDLLDILFTRTWWRYEPGSLSVYNEPYHWFNLAEAGAWFVFAALVARRHLIHRNGSIEWWYALAFVAFGFTDVIESQALTSWLIWIKLANLIALIWLRAVVMRRYYPQSKLY